MICKSLLFFFCYLVKYHEILLHHIAFFTYDSYIVYRLFFIYTAFSLHYCTYHMYGTYIFNNNISHEFLSHTMYTVFHVLQVLWNSSPLFVTQSFT